MQTLLTEGESLSIFASTVRPEDKYIVLTGICSPAGLSLFFLTLILTVDGYEMVVSVCEHCEAPHSGRSSFLMVLMLPYTGGCFRAIFLSVNNVVTPI